MESILTSVKAYIGPSADYDVFDPENVISTCLETHNAIHYGDIDLLVTDPVIRTRNDTCPWKR